MNSVKCLNVQMYRFYISIHPHDICYLSWTINAYEGIGFLTTDDPGKGLVSVYSTLGNEDIMREVINSVLEEGTDLRILGEITE